MMWFVVWLWRFSWGFVLHGWIHFTMNACTHGMGWRYKTDTMFTNMSVVKRIKNITILMSSAKCTFLTQKNSTPIICFRYQKVSYHTYFFAIGLCYARPPKHMSSWHAISSLFGKNTKNRWKTWVCYSQVYHHIYGCAPTIQKNAHTHTQNNDKIRTWVVRTRKL